MVLPTLVSETQRPDQCRKSRHTIRRGEVVSVNLINTVFIPMSNLFSDFSLNARYSKKGNLSINPPLLQDLKTIKIFNHSNL